MKIYIQKFTFEKMPVDVDVKTERTDVFIIIQQRERAPFCSNLVGAWFQDEKRRRKDQTKDCSRIHHHFTLSSSLQSIEEQFANQS